MDREEAIEIIRKNMPSDKSLPVYEALQTLIPELKESEDERIRKFLIEHVSEWIGCIEYDLKFSSKDVESEEELAMFKAGLAYLEKQKEYALTEEDKKIIPEALVMLCDDIINHRVHTPIKTDEEGARKIKAFLKSFNRQPHKTMKEWEKQKEQKPVESISQQTVQGKGVYKICPRCKERMIRDDSMVYTSMPPQYRYECPKCGESECDTVMYDNPEIEEQKPAVTHGETYHVDTLGTQQVIAGKMPQKSTEWSEEDEKNLKSVVSTLWFALNTPHFPLNYERIIELETWLKSLSPSWKPSEEQMKALKEVAYNIVGTGTETDVHLVQLYEQLKRL